MKLCLTARAGAGKDYLTELLIKYFKFNRFSFSDQLKQECAAIFPWLEKDYPPHIKETKIKFETGFETIEKTPRDIWLTIGEALRKIEPKIFVRMMDENLKMVNVENIVISDLRTTDELNYIKENGFKIIFIEPQQEIYAKNDFDNELEAFKEIADYVFVNKFNGTKDFLEFMDSIKDSI